MTDRSTPPPPRSVVVVGAGIIGLCTAWYLREGGADVTVVDRRRAGTGASLANAGWISPSLSAPLPAPGMASTALRSLADPDGAFRIRPTTAVRMLPWLAGFWRAGRRGRHRAGRAATTELARDALARFDELEASGVEFEMHRRGLLVACLDGSHAVAQLQQLRAAGVGGLDEVGLLDGPAARRVEPALGPRVEAAVLLREERHVDPGSLCRGLVTSLERRGVDVLEGLEVIELLRRGPRVSGVTTTSGVLEADAVVIAAGAWSTRLARRLGVPLPMEPGRGFSVTTDLPRPPRHAVLLAEAKVAMSPLDLGTRIAGTMEFAGFDERRDATRIRAMLRGARSYLSSWNPTGIRDAWTGLRPVPMDGLPVIGPTRAHPEVFLATGHGMNGVTLGPSSGRALAQNVLEGHIPEVLRPFGPGRFR